MSGRSQIVKARGDDPLRAQALDLRRDFQIGSRVLQDVNAKDAASDADARHPWAVSRQRVATSEAVLFLCDDAGWIVETAVRRFFGGGLLSGEHKSIRTGLSFIIPARDR